MVFHGSEHLFSRCAQLGLLRVTHSKQIYFGSPLWMMKMPPLQPHTSGDGDPDTEQSLRVMVLQSTAPCCTPRPGVKVNLLLKNICFTKDELYQVLKGANSKTGHVRVQICHMADLEHCGFGIYLFFSSFSCY